jgi:hypothetical protein
MQILVAILALLIGAAFCFGGWRFFLILLPIWGLVVGFGLGTEATRALLGDGTFATITSWAIGIVFALVFAVLSYLFWYGAIAILAGTIGYAIGAAAWGIIGNETGLIAFLIGIAVGAVFAIGTLVLNVPRYLVIALTAIGGAAVMVAGWFILTGQIPTDNITWTTIGAQIGDSFIWLVVWLVLAGLGLAVQAFAPAVGPDAYELDRSSYRYGA